MGSCHFLQPHLAIQAPGQTGGPPLISSAHTHLIDSEGLELRGVQAVGVRWMEVQAHGHGLQWRHTAGIWGHPEGAIRPVCPDHRDLALGVVHQAQGDRVGVLRPGAGTKVHLRGLYADWWGEDGYVIGAIEEVLSHGGNERILRG